MASSDAALREPHMYLKSLRRMPRLSIHMPQARCVDRSNGEECNERCNAIKLKSSNRPQIISSAGRIAKPRQTASGVPMQRHFDSEITRPDQVPDQTIDCLQVPDAEKRFEIIKHPAAQGAVSCNSGSTHLPCSLMRSTNRSTASASGMLNLIGVLPT